MRWDCSTSADATRPLASVNPEPAAKHEKERVMYIRDPESHARLLAVGHNMLPNCVKEILRICEVCKGEGSYQQRYNAGCGGGYFHMRGDCDYCGGTGVQRFDPRVAHKHGHPSEAWGKSDLLAARLVVRLGELQELYRADKDQRTAA